MRYRARKSQEAIEVDTQNADDDENGGFFYDEEAAAEASGRAAALEHLDSVLQIPQEDELDEVRSHCLFHA